MTLSAFISFGPKKRVGLNIYGLSTLNHFNNRKKNQQQKRLFIFASNIEGLLCAFSRNLIELMSVTGLKTFLQKQLRKFYLLRNWNEMRRNHSQSYIVCT
jgi:hypothetical protein